MGIRSSCIHLMNLLRSALLLVVEIGMSNGDDVRVGAVSSVLVGTYGEDEWVDDHLSKQVLFGELVTTRTFHRSRLQRRYIVLRDIQMQLV